MKIDRSRKTLRVLAVVAAASAALAACSSQGGAPASQPAAGGGGGGGGTGQSYTIAMITHEAPGDSFWDKIRAGAEQAAKDTGVTLQVLEQPGLRSAGHAGAERHRQQGQRHRRDPRQPGRGGPGGPEGRSRPASRSSRSTPASATTSNTASPMYFGSDEDARRAGRGDEAAAGRRRQGHLRDPGAGPGRAGDPLRRREDGLREHREPAGQPAPTCRRCSRPSAPSSSRTRRSTGS